MALNKQNRTIITIGENKDKVYFWDTKKKNRRI